MDSTSILYSKSSPVSFLEWLESQDRISPDYNFNFKKYQEYIKNWCENHNDKTIDSKNVFYNLYIDFLREITLNFSTEEEKRFIVNFDFSKTDNLDIVLPFYIDKLKQICIFYSDKREKLRATISNIPYKGTNISVKKIVKSIILNEIENNTIQKESEGRIAFPSLSAINKNLEIKVEELYDTTNYYDSREKPNNFGDIEIDSNLYNDFKEAIKAAIRQYPLFLDTLFGSFSINYSLTGDELNYLKQRDFLNYVNTLSSEDLKLNFKRKLAPKYVSSDFYYLSVGDTATNVVTGLLFKTDPLTGSRIQNLSNRNESRIATTQKIDNLYTAYELGKFFIPNYTGVLQYNAFKKNFAINYNKLTPNSVYVFPDPTVIESKNSPLVYKVKVDWSKIGIEGGYNFGGIISDSHYHRFYAYESYSQDIGNTPLGLSIYKDNIDFWSGEQDSVWTEKDIWPGLNEVDRLPLESRLKTLLIDEGVITEWYTDIYGNQFGLYKNLNYSNSIYDKKKGVPGNVYVKNTATNLVSSFKHFFYKTLLKYPKIIFDELIDNTYSFYLIKNVFVLETKNYVIVDSYECDLEDGTFINTLLPGIYIPKHQINENLEKFINSFYVESTNKLYLCFLKLNPSLSASNYKALVPAIFEIDVDSLNITQSYPKRDISSTVYSLSSRLYKDFPEIDIRYIEGGKFSFKERLDIFNLTYIAYNLNNIPFFVNEQFAIQDGSAELVSFESLMHKPYVYVRDTNYVNPSVDTTVKYTATYSELVGGKDPHNFKWEILEEKGDNFYFCSNINPAIINRPGSHYVQFDWDKYLLGNVFVGCEPISVAYADNKNVIGFRDGRAPITLADEEVVYKIRDYSFFGYSFSLSAMRPRNTNGGIIHFTTSEAPAGFEGNFCNNLFSLYRKVIITLGGDPRGIDPAGVGVVNGDPACLDCPPVCKFDYPLFSTITLLPSADPRSVFVGWRGTPCDGVGGNCIVTVTDNTYLTAFFVKIPFWNLKLVSNIPNTTVSTIDGNIFCGNQCVYEYKDGSVVGLSAGPAPEGYVFDSFKGGPLCGSNNPCGITMTKNYTITAVYVRATNKLTLGKKFRDLEYGYILAKTRLGSQAMVASNTDRAIFYHKNDDGSVGHLKCSLDPTVEIKGYAEFDDVLRNKFVTISGVGQNGYIFRRWEGNPCRTTVGNICNFNLTNNYTITGVISPPDFTVSILTSGSGTFYIESRDGKINCGTRAFVNEKRDCFESYLSGTFVYLSGVSTEGSKLFSMCANNTFFTVADYNNIVGSDKLELGLYVNNNIVLTAVGGSDGFRTLTVIKSASNSSIRPQTLNSQITVRVPSLETYVIGAGIENRTYVIPKEASVIITPSFTPNTIRHSHTQGYSGLFYKYDSNIFTFAPDITATLKDRDVFNPVGNIMVIQNNGAPYYSTVNNVVNIINRETYLTLTENATAILVYTPLT